MWRDERRRQDDGIALIAVLFAVLVLTGIATLLAAIAIAETRATGSNRDYENAIHVAEAGADAVVAQLNTDEDFYTTTASCDKGVGLDSLGSDEQQWAIERIDACGLLASAVGDSGESYAFRPVEDATVLGTSADPIVPVDLVYGISFVPFKGAADEDVRVVKYQYDRQVLEPQHGLQTCGDLTIGGNASVSGTLGSVRSNGDINISGSSYSIEQQLAASGAIAGDTSNAGSSDAFSPDEFCPELDVSTFYVHAQTPAYTCYGTNGRPDPGDSGAGCAVSTDDEPILWWDLCPDGTVRESGSVPCSGDVTWSGAAGETNQFNGWKYQANDWKAPNGLKTGIYYVYLEDVDSISGGSGTVTVFVEADDSDTGQTGSLGLSGNGTFTPAFDEVLFAVDRDLDMNGNAGGGGEVDGLQLEGFIGVGEQVKLDGTASLNGAIYAQDQPHTTSSPVAVSTLQGNYTINHDEDLTVPTTGLVRITAWNELK